MIIKGSFDIADRDRANIYLPNLTSRGFIDLEKTSKICNQGYKVGLFDPFFEELNSLE